MEASYLTNLDYLKETGEELFSLLEKCILCPNNCGVNRLNNEKGNCNSSEKLVIASYNLHHGEEPPISGIKGSGTVFFANCTLECCFCQNYPISHFGYGEIVTETRLAEVFLSLQAKGAHNINLVTPTHFLPQILKALHTAAIKGLSIPIVYNSSGYEKKSIIQKLDGIIDIYLPDAKYADDGIANEYSGAVNYVKNNRDSLKEMFRQTGILKCNNTIGVRGLIIRHLVLPNGLAGTLELLNFLKSNLSLDIKLGLMSQYFPAHKAVGHHKIGHRLYRDEYMDIVEKAEEMGFTNLLIQRL